MARPLSALRTKRSSDTLDDNNRNGIFITICRRSINAFLWIDLKGHVLAKFYFSSIANSFDPILFLFSYLLFLLMAVESVSPNFFRRCFWRETHTWQAFFLLKIYEAVQKMIYTSIAVSNFYKFAIKELLPSLNLVLVTSDFYVASLTISCTCV